MKDAKSTASCTVKYLNPINAPSFCESFFLVYFTHLKSSKKDNIGIPHVTISSIMFGRVTTALFMACLNLSPSN